ncbi:MAG: HAMP domain-containing protein [Sorangiineae bacterium PRO1]|nr:HAMP domain-containing protein [Sorangiineae bacterium PRO1]
MARSGRIRRRLSLAIGLTALIPMLGAIWMARSMVRQTASRFYLPEIGTRLDQSLGLYQELARSVKASMRNAAAAIAAGAALRKATAAGDADATKDELSKELGKYPGLVSLSVYSADGKLLASVDRGTPLDPVKENRLEVTRYLGEEAPPPDTGNEQYDPEEPPENDAAAPEEPDAPRAAKLVAVFAADKARFEELEGMSQFVDTYKQIEQRREIDEESYVYSFAALLGITIIAAFGVGTLLARGVSSRIGGLAAATKRVGAGDLAIRVPETGSDEIADLARAFNRMLGEVEASRARIEYLQRIGAWQEMARRLAHEIKNPLTPIQLAVQEVHRRYEGEDDKYRKLLDTTREVVEDEVGTLRRLVGEFSSFARLPQAQLEKADLAEFLREQRERISVVDDEGMLDSEAPLAHGAVLPRGVELEFELPEGVAEAHIDRQMLRRALLNLIRNAGQAIAGAGRGEGRVLVRLERKGEQWSIDVDDDGPGIPAEMRQSVFDPYFTTKTEGTGLGLAIVKKIIMEHGGSIAAESSSFGGARMRVTLPVAGTSAAHAALEARQWQGPPSSARPKPDSEPRAK